LTANRNRFAALVAAGFIVIAAPAQSQEQTQQTAETQTQKEQSKPCRWWQLGRCNEETVVIEGLPADAPKADTLITVDVSTNTAYLFNDGELVAKAPAATGTGKVLKKGKKIWAFHTPRGHMKVLRKIADPVWRKPDWAFVEAGEPIPPPNSKSREVRGHLGKYALDLGDGIMIHGTDEIDSLGRKASHGCVRLGNEMLERVWQATKVGTDVYIFESNPPQQAQTTTADGTRKPEHRSDLD
jgi:L,D-transpeptidase ErfK/SrfK